jgi:MFS family permease
LTLLSRGGIIFRSRRNRNAENRSAKELEAFRLVVLLGTISLFIDMATDGYYSVVGSYLGTLGATAAIVAIITGIAGLVSYTPRLVSGWYCDQTGHYWSLMGLGLMINFVSIPILALAGHWELAFVVIVLDRLGRALRSPARDAIISHAAKDMGGVGKAFGLHEAMSDIGSMVGPVIVALILEADYGYSMAIGVLIVPAFLAMVILVLTMRWYPKPMELEQKCAKSDKETKTKLKLPGLFWIYIMGAGLIAAAFIDFPLISYHMTADDNIEDFWVPVLYAVAMGLDAISAIVFGHIYDRVGVKAVAAVFCLSAFFVPLVFDSDPLMMVAGIMLWGVGQGAMGSILRSVVAELVPRDRRGVGFGIFSTTYGIMWFLGNATMGVLYDISIPLMVAFSMSVQFAAVAVFIYVQRRVAKDPDSKCPV